MGTAEIKVRITDETEGDEIMEAFGTYGYALQHGPDTRHLICSEKFKLLRNAKAKVDSLPEGRAFRLWRLLTDGKEFSTLFDGGTISERIV